MRKDLCDSLVDTPIGDFDLEEMNVPEQLFEEVEARRGALPPPTPLPTEGEPAEFPVDALGVTLGYALRAAQDATRSPAALSAQSLLAAASLATQGLADVEFDPIVGPVPLSLFLVSVARSGERKSGNDKLALAPVRDWAECQAGAYQAEARRHRDDADVYERSRKSIINSKKTPEDKITALDMLGEPPNDPIDPRIVTTNSLTIQGLSAHLKMGRPSIGILADDGATFLGGYSMSSDNRSATVAALCNWWDGRSPEGLTKSGGASFLPGRRVCFHLMIQQRLAAGLFSDEDIRDQGLMGRILAVWPKSTMGTRTRRPLAPSTMGAIEDYSEAIYRLMQRELVTAQDDPRELKPRVLKLDPGARELLYAFGDEVEVQLGDGGYYSEISSLAAKSAEQAGRLAGVIALVDDPNRESIPVETIASGITLMRFYLDEALRIRGVSRLDQSVKDAQSIVDWLGGSGASLLEDGCIRRNVIQSRRRTLNRERFAEAVSVLLEHGILIELEEPDSRRSPLYRFNDLHDEAIEMLKEARP